MRISPLLAVTAIMLVSGCLNAGDSLSEGNHPEPTTSIPPSPAPDASPTPNPSTERLEGTITQVGFDMPNETSMIIVPGCGSRGLPAPQLDFTVPENTTRLAFVLTWGLAGEMLFLDVTPPDNTTIVIRDDVSALNNQRIEGTVDSPQPGQWVALPCPLGATTELPFILEVTLSSNAVAP